MRCSDPASDEPDGTAECANCGAPVETGEWHPAATDSRDGDGLAIVSFCSWECRADWTTDSSSTPHNSQ